MKFSTYLVLLVVAAMLIVSSLACVIVDDDCHEECYNTCYEFEVCDRYECWWETSCNERECELFCEDRERGFHVETGR